MLSPLNGMIADPCFVTDRVCVCLIMIYVLVNFTIRQYHYNQRFI
jgi:hypothetical protein